MPRKNASSVRKGVAAIIFRWRDEVPEFLVMHRTLRWTGWETLKGGILPDEDEDSALLREIEEETGLGRGDVRIVGKIPGASIRFIIPPRFREELGGFRSSAYKPFYLVEASPNAKPNLKGDTEREHDDVRFVPHSKALHMLTYANTRSALKKAVRFVSSRR